MLIQQILDILLHAISLPLLIAAGRIARNARPAEKLAFQRLHQRLEGESNT